MRRLQAWLLLTLALLAGSALAGDDWDDFTNNLFTDLAPLLALFGERVTMQYMSQATSWEDCVVLAMAPLGIITIIVSAIRVGGPMVLKAIVGRARENTTAAEMELMSSTSREVCELFNGETVVRCQGSAPVWEFIVVSPKDLDVSKSDVVPKLEFMTLEQATKDGANPPLVRVSPAADSASSGSSSLSSASMSSGDASSTAPGDAASTSLARRNDMFASSDPLGKVKALLKELLDRLRRVKKRPSMEAMVEEGVPASPASAGGSEASRRSRDSPEAQLHSPQQKPNGATSLGLASPPSEQNDAASGAPRPSQTPSESTPGEDDHTGPTITVIKDNRRDAPNISLNLYDSHDLRETRLVALIGIVLQLSVLTWFTAITHHPTFRLNFKKEDQFASSYAFPMATGGTVLLVFGLLLCAHVVEDSTQEERYRVADSSAKMDIYWLQQEQMVNDQNFESFATSPSSSRDVITMSRRRRKDHGAVGTGRLMTVVGVVASLFGYIVQFVGLRGMHSAASLAQLVAIGIMAALRAWVRRGVATPFGRDRLIPGYELDWLAWRLVSMGQPAGGKSATEEPPTSNRPSPEAASRDGPNAPKRPFGEALSGLSEGNCCTDPGQGQWRVVNGMKTSYKPLIGRGAPDSPTPRFSMSKARRILEARRMLGQLTHYKGPTSAGAVNVAVSIKKAMDFLFVRDSKENARYSWVLHVSYAESPSAKETVLEIPIELRQEDGAWSVMAEDLDAALSLWAHSVRFRDSCSASGASPGSGNTDALGYRLFRGGGLTAAFRMLGPDGSAPRDSDEKELRDSLNQDLRWWAPESLRMTSYSARRSSIKISNNTKLAGCSPSKNKTCALSVLSESTLSIRSHDPLEMFHAKDLFFSFMCSAAKTLKRRIAGKVDCHMDVDLSKTEMSIYLHHEGLSSLAESLAQHSLGSKSEIFLSLIPPLSMAGTLPFPQPIFELAQQRAVDKLKVKSIAAAAKILGSLWFSVKMHASTNFDIWCAGAVVCIEYHQYLESYIKRMKVENQDIEYGITDSQDNIINWYMRWGPDEWVRHFSKSLARLYEQQHRVLDSWMTSRLDILGLPHCAEGLPSYFNVTPAHTRFMNSRSSKAQGASLSREQLDDRDLLGWTPLHYAAANNTNLEDLFDFPGVNTNVDLRGYTAFHVACAHANRRCVKGLLQAGARIDIQAHDGLYPMHIAAAEGNLNIIKTWNATSAAGFKLRKLAAQNCKRHGIPAKSPWQLTDYEGRLPVHWAVINGNPEVVDELKADVDAKDDQGWSSLHMAVVYERHRLIDMLYALSSNPNSRDADGRTPLLLACEKSKWKVAALLLDRKVAVDVMDNSGSTALHYAFRENSGSGIIHTLFEMSSCNSDAPADPGPPSRSQDEPARIPPHIKKLIDENYEGPEYWAETFYGLVMALGPVKVWNCI